MNKVGTFFKNAFADMKESTQAQHTVDRANFAAAKAEAGAQWEEAKAMSRPEVRRAVEQAKREEQLSKAKARTLAAQERSTAARGQK